MDLELIGQLTRQTIFLGNWVGGLFFHLADRLIDFSPAGWTSGAFSWPIGLVFSMEGASDQPPLQPDPLAVQKKRVEEASY
jgi:hypothetical protein